MLTPNTKRVTVQPKSPGPDEVDPEIDETLHMLDELDLDEEEEKIDSPDTLQKRVFRLNPLSKLRNKISHTLSRDSTMSVSRSLSQTGSHTPPNCTPDPKRRPAHLESIDSSKLSSRSGSVASSRSSHSSRSQTRSQSHSGHSNQISSINSESSYNTQWSRGTSRSSLSSLSSMEWDSKNMKKWSKSKLKQVLFRCTRHGRYKEVRSMLEKGVNPNMTDEYGNTILIVAAQNGSKRLVKTALRFSANINHQNYRGNTATHYAFAYGYRTLAEYILSKGADDRLMNEQGLVCYKGISNVENGVRKGKERSKAKGKDSKSKKHVLPDVNVQSS